MSMLKFKKKINDLCPSSAKRPGIIRVTRDLPPSHFLFKINSFSLLAVSKSVEKRESCGFEVGGYKWRLVLYPNGNKKSNGNGFISLYLQIVETEKLPSGWQINVNFKLFVFDQIRDKYLTLEDAGAVKRFHSMKTEWGFDQVLSLKCFKDASNGYLVNDSCVFGAEVFVIEQITTNREDLSMIKQSTGNLLSLKIENFSKLGEEYYESPSQTAAGFKWKLLVYPNGCYHVKGTALSVYLGLAEAPALPPMSLYVKFKLRLMDQFSSNHLERTYMGWLGDRKEVLGRDGYHDLISLKDLRDASKGFLVKDTFTIEAKIISISNVKRVSDNFVTDLISVT